MKPTVLLDQVTTPNGRPMTLHERDGVFMIRIAGMELMSIRQHHSEERLAELACSHVRTTSDGRSVSTRCVTAPAVDSGTAGS